MKKPRLNTRIATSQSMADEHFASKSTLVTKADCNVTAKMELLSIDTFVSEFRQTEMKNFKKKYSRTNRSLLSENPLVDRDEVRTSRRPDSQKRTKVDANKPLCGTLALGR